MLRKNAIILTLTAIAAFLPVFSFVSAEDDDEEESVYTERERRSYEQRRLGEDDGEEGGRSSQREEDGDGEDQSEDEESKNQESENVTPSEPKISTNEITKEATQKEANSKSQYETQTLTVLETQISNETVVLVDTDRDGLPDVRDPHPTIPEFLIVGDVDGDGITDAYRGVNVVADQNANGIADKFENMEFSDAQ